MWKVLTAALILLVTVSLGFAQSLVLMPYGVSPAAVKADTVGDPGYLGIKDRTSSGLLNVGVESKVYLIATFEDSALTSPAWDLLGKPENSAAVLAGPTAVDEASEIATFIADLAGTYRIAISEGTYADTVVINAATYKGVEGQAPNCKNCHGSVTALWQETGHANFLDNALEGMGRSGASCLPCHTTGWDPDATNDGFDDFDFLYPATPGAGMVDSLTQEYPDAMVRANIQCETCHGPGSAHVAGFGTTDDSKMLASIEPEACAVCHDDDHYHVYPSQYETSGHAKVMAYPGGTRTNCSGCHNGLQFIQFTKGETITQQPYAAITCAVCHDPHDATNEYQIRTVEATLANGETVTQGGTGKLCMNCHKSRRDAATYPTKPASHFGPHYAPQADMILGTNVVTFGNQLPSSPHLSATDNGCVDCHMWEAGNHGEHDAEGNLTTFGMHSFSMVNTMGAENVYSCEGAGCHGPVGESFADKKYYINGNADHDGDGIQEGLQDEVHGLLDSLAAMLPAAEGHDAYDPHDDVDSTWTVTELQAAYNYQMVYYDHSYGIHNPAFTVALLKVSIEALGGATSIDFGDQIAPLEYALSQNYPNPFNPTTQINYTIRTAGKVQIRVYDILGKEVSTLVNDDMMPGKYTVQFDAGNLASGVYIYRIMAANEFTAVKKMVLVR